MITTETRYITEDGAVFYNVYRAKQHERMLRVMGKIRTAVDTIVQGTDLFDEEELVVKIYNAISSELADA